MYAIPGLYILLDDAWKGKHCAERAMIEAHRNLLEISLANGITIKLVGTFINDESPLWW